MTPSYDFQATELVITFRHYENCAGYTDSSISIPKEEFEKWLGLDHLRNELKEAERIAWAGIAGGY